MTHIERIKLQLKRFISLLTIKETTRPKCSREQISLYCILYSKGKKHRNIESWGKEHISHSNITQLKFYLTVLSLLVSDSKSRLAFE